MPLIPGLQWTVLPSNQARDIFAQLLGVTDEARRDLLAVEGHAAALPFYKRWRLVWLALQSRDPDNEDPTEDVYALWREGVEPVLLDGTSGPVHDTNADEELKLEDDQVPDYIRWFCFAVRGDDHPFILFEQLRLGVGGRAAKVSARNAKAAAMAQPLTAKGRSADGALEYETTVIFDRAAFKAVFAVKPSGLIEMVDDEPLTAAFPVALTPIMPPLGLGPRLVARLTLLFASTPTATTPTHAAKRVVGGRRRPRRKPAPSTRPTIVELVELLLVRALRDQSQNRLLGFFNATLPSAGELARLAALLGGASPVIVVETAIPFVEETISDIVNGLRPPNARMIVSHGHVETDGNGVEYLTSYSLPSQGPAMVLLPLLVYRRVEQVERLAFELATNDLAALITCERVADLPEALNRYTDLVLHLPDIDTPIFETLFERVIGAPPPAGWGSGGAEWVKHLLHTDFEHPRRMMLSQDEAYAFVRAQVADRLRSVDPGQGLALDELHGLGEARQFAEDLIADIHAAMAGKLPWSQVDRGALLVGAPGTGKTTLAKAIAKACGVKFIQGSAAGWMAEGVTLGPHIAAIRRTFREARNYAPSILFIDEIDSLGSRENFTRDNNSIYQTEVINAVLEQMQGLDPLAPVFVIGATNHENAVDPALRRSGRLDRVIRIPRPNSAALDHIYRYYIGQLGSGIRVAAKLDTQALGRLSVGLTGADVERIVRGAARRARKANRAMSQIDVIDEITNKPQSPEARVTLTPAELEATAVHEAGHALALFMSRSKGVDIGFVTIVPREDGTLGFVAPLPDERVHLTRADYDEKLQVFVAGRAAEELTWGKEGVSSGSSTDLHQATILAIQMVTQLGLAGGSRLLWTEKPSAADLERADLALTQAYERILAKLKKNRGRLMALAKELVLRQELPGDDVRKILAT